MTGVVLVVTDTERERDERHTRDERLQCEGVSGNDRSNNPALHQVQPGPVVHLVGYCTT